MTGVLGAIERVGNKVPHPAILFLALIVILIGLSQILYWAGAGVTYEVIKPPPALVEETYIGGSVEPGEILPAEAADADDYSVVTQTVEVKGLLTVDGVRFLFTSFVSNFMGFTAMGIILIVMIGVGLAETSGLIGALIRKLVAISSEGALTYIIVFLGVISSIASDAGYLVLIPLGAAAFMSVGRHPLAGIAAAFAGVAGGFGVNFLITPTDAILTEITNEAIGLVDSGPDDRSHLEPLLRHRLDDPHHAHRRDHDDPRSSSRASASTTPPRLPTRRRTRPSDRGSTPSRRPKRRGGCAGRVAGVLAVVILIAALTIPSGAPLRDPVTGRRDRHLALHGQPGRDDLAGLPRGGSLLRAGGRAPSGPAPTRSTRSPSRGRASRGCCSSSC